MAIFDFTFQGVMRGAAADLLAGMLYERMLVPST